MSDEAPTLAGFATFIERKQRPDHVGIPRKRMELTFAVQLMRLSYAVVDDLDFVPMDEFQRDFFLFRQDEWEDYRGYHPTVMQGDLADPLYLDFIRYGQTDKQRRVRLNERGCYRTGLHHRISSHDLQTKESAHSDCDYHLKGIKQ
jgi:hypothetical protein